MSNGNDDPRIVVLQEQLTKVKMHPTERDALADDLKYAHDINGDTAPVMQMLKTMFIQNVRRELLAIARAESHYKNCLVAGQIKEDENGNMTMPWDRMLKEHHQKFHIEGDAEEDKLDQELKDAREALAKQKEVEAELKTSVVTVGKYLSFRGPITKWAVILIGILGYMYISNMRQEENIKKNLQEQLPVLLKAIKASSADIAKTDKDDEK